MQTSWGVAICCLLEGQIPVHLNLSPHFYEHLKNKHLKPSSWLLQQPVWWEWCFMYDSCKFFTCAKMLYPEVTSEIYETSQKWHKSDNWWQNQYICARTDMRKKEWKYSSYKNVHMLWSQYFHAFCMAANHWYTQQVLWHTNSYIPYLLHRITVS